MAEAAGEDIITAAVEPATGAEATDIENPAGEDFNSPAHAPGVCQLLLTFFGAIKQDSCSASAAYFLCAALYIKIKSTFPMGGCFYAIYES